MTPIPLLLGLFVKKIKERFEGKQQEVSSSDEENDVLNGIVKGTTIVGGGNCKFNNPINGVKEIVDRNCQGSESTQQLMVAENRSYSPKDEASTNVNVDTQHSP